MDKHVQPPLQGREVAILRTDPLFPLTERFEKVYGPGSATPKNMDQVSLTMQKMAAALRDDGTKGYVADAYSDKSSRVLGHAVPNSKTISVNVGNQWFKNAFQLSWTAGHESGHTVGLGHGTVNGVTAYKYSSNDVEKDAYKNLPTAQRFNNPDHYLDFAR